MIFPRSDVTRYVRLVRAYNLRMRASTQGWIYALALICVFYFLRNCTSFIINSVLSKKLLLKISPRETGGESCLNPSQSNSKKCLLKSFPRVTLGIFFVFKQKSPRPKFIDKLGGSDNTIVRIPTLRCAILGLRKFLECAEHLH